MVKLYGVIQIGKAVWSGKRGTSASNYSIIFGTLKKWFSRAGAFASSASGLG